MEFSAIALLINSYYCKNNRLPSSIEELEKWSGTKLPINRFENKPFVIDLKSKATLTFKMLVKPNQYKSDSFYFNKNNK